MGVKKVPQLAHSYPVWEEGLEQSFNSLDAQREACEAFILSQRQVGPTDGR
jgi:hypothetical protein